MSIINFTPLPAAIGGALIGLAAVILMLFSGRIAGVSGILRSALISNDRRWDSAAFVIGLIAAPVLWTAVTGNAVPQTVSTDLLLLGVAGFLVGIGVTIGNGCTSGHGVCGLSRFSLRSLAATATFMAVAIAVVYVSRHVVGGVQ